MMKKSNQIILSALGAIFIFSIAFQLHVNRHLRSSKPIENTLTTVSELRSIGNFNKIIIKHGIEVYFTQDSISECRIEAAEHIMSNIKTVVEQDQLVIERIKQTKDRSVVKVFVAHNQLTLVKAHSSSYFKTVGVVNGEHLELEFASDTRANLELSYTSVQCKAASGSQIAFKGDTANIEFTN